MGERFTFHKIVAGHERNKRRKSFTFLIKMI
jgi:hypothetical protein